MSSGLFIRLSVRLADIAMRDTVGDGSTPNSAAISQARQYLNALMYPGGNESTVSSVAG